MKGYFKDFQIKGDIYRFVFTSHARERMKSRKVKDREILLSFERIDGITIEGFIREGKEIIIIDEEMGFSMVLDFKDALNKAEGKAIKLVTVIDKTEVFAKRGTDLVAV